jgi:hypothetical protein
MLSELYWEAVVLRQAALPFVFGVVLVSRVPLWLRRVFIYLRNFSRTRSVYHAGASVSAWVRG